MNDFFRRARRQFLKHSTIAGGAVLAGGLPGILRAQTAPAIVPSDGLRPVAAQGLQIGDVLADRAIIWSRADRPARMIVEYARDESFRNALRIVGPHAIEVTDYTARVDLPDLPEDEEVFVRVKFQNLDSGKAESEPVVGRFHTAPQRKRRDVTFVWSGDTAGQGWGINPDFGGMKIYEAMRRAKPDFFIHSGDNIYADGPILPQVTLPDGRIWRNLTTEAKSKVAETLAEYRGNYLYNLLDDNVRRFNAEVPQVWQWDDHEVLNNWSDSKDLSGDARYAEKRVPLLVARAERAFLEYSPMRWHTQDESERVYRHVPYGKDLDVFVVDMRSYRGPNSYNRQTEAGPDTRFLGGVQLEWLREQLKKSRATWKVIAADMPIGLLVGDGKDAQGRDKFEAIANGNGPALGRELETAGLLSFIKRSGIRNVVWLTADVHYCAAHYYDPSKAVFNDFEPFWEFVAGPLNAGAFGPNTLDNTFGPQVVFQKYPPSPNASPLEGYQFFGQVDIDGRSKDMIVSLKDINGATVFSKRLHARVERHGSDD
jgi:alkaline phosphatase D